MLKRLQSAARLLMTHLTGRSASHQERFDLLFEALPDPWKFRHSAFEHERYARLLAAISASRAEARYHRVLEVGCAEGYFTPRLAEVAEQVVGLDVSGVALHRAQKAVGGDPRFQFVHHDMSTGPLAEPFDLIVASEVLYFFEEPAVLNQVATHLIDSLTPGGTLVLSHMRLLKDDVAGHARTISGYPRMGAASVHPVFKAHPRLYLIAEELYPLYAICVLKRGDDAQTA